MVVPFNRPQIASVTVVYLGAGVMEEESLTSGASIYGYGGRADGRHG